MLRPTGSAGRQNDWQMRAQPVLQVPSIRFDSMVANSYWTGSTDSRGTCPKILDSYSDKTNGRDNCLDPRSRCSTEFNFRRLTSIQRTSLRYSNSSFRKARIAGVSCLSQAAKLSTSSDRSGLKTVQVDDCLPDPADEKGRRRDWEFRFATCICGNWP